MEDTVFTLTLSSTKAWKWPLGTSPEQTVLDDDEFEADTGHHPIPAEEEQTREMSPELELLDDTESSVTNPTVPVEEVGELHVTYDKEVTK